MLAVEMLRYSMQRTRWITKMFLESMSNADLLVRPVPGANHLAWQLGHLIASEHGMVESVRPGSMPPLPEGFALKHTQETAGIDTPGQFLSKDEYIRLYDEQREGTLKVLESLSESEFSAPSAERMRDYAPTVKDVFTLANDHELMHMGQATCLRRKLGMPHAF